MVPAQVSSSSSSSPFPGQSASRRTVHDHRQARPYPSTSGSERYLNAFESTNVIDGLAQISIALAPHQAEPTQQTRFTDLTNEELSTMIMSTRATLSATLHELETIDLKIIEKEKQITHMKTILKSQNRRIEDTEAALSNLEEYARRRNIDVDAFLREHERKEAAFRKRMLRAEALSDDDDDAGDESNGSNDSMMSDDTARPFTRL